PQPIEVLKKENHDFTAASSRQCVYMFVFTGHE
ncbi:MAG: hypothetical protein Greene041619_230, partial [Candidatus Peregrinibacteria bacterium Greene0416_19]